MGSKVILLIDSDSLCYLGTKGDTVPQVIEKVDNKIQDIIDFADAEYYSLFISRGRYFRHELKSKSEESGSYKANRPQRQDFSKIIKEYLVAKYKANWYKGAEADDAVAYWYKKKDLRKESYTPVLATVDKDLLKSIAGNHVNYNKKTGKDTWEIVWQETTDIEAIGFQKMQMIVGDSGDGVKGIPGKGIKYWENVVMKDGKLPSMDTILTAYGAHYNTIGEAIYEFQKNYRMLHLLDNDQDWLREVGYLPEVPLFHKVERDESNDIKEFE